MDHITIQITGDGNFGLQIDDDDVNFGLQIDDDDVYEPRLVVFGPEKRLTLFALQLVALEKIANGLRTLALLWATAVLLGGYAIILSRIDFWFMTIIISSEGVIILTGRHGIQFTQQSSWTISEALKSSSLCSIVRASKGIVGQVPEQGATRLPMYPTRTWESSDVPLLPYGGWFLVSRKIGKLVYWMQLSSAIACMSLSMVRLIPLSHANAIEPSPESKNERYALILFYGLSLAQALSSLSQKIYWEWMIGHRKLLEEVNSECEFGTYGMILIKRFFFAAYSACLNGSIFDGLKLDLVSFATELLSSDSNDKLLIGTHILLRFLTNPRFCDDTVGRIVKSVTVFERLVEMLNWENPREAEIRRAAAEILSKLVGKRQHSLQVAGIPGAMVSISSLLHIPRSSDGASNEIREKSFICDRENYEFSVFNRLGLTILRKLAHDNDNCEMIRKTRGLLPKIIEFTYTGVSLLKDSHDTCGWIPQVKRSLQVLKLLAGASDTVGKNLRQEIVQNVFIVSNIREILKYGEKYPKLQLLGITILISLAFDVEATERIGSTGGMIEELFRIFFQEPNTEYQNHVSPAAGEAIAMLALDSDRNCSRILKQEVLTKLVGALEDPVLRINSARILRYLCIFAGEDCFVKLRRISDAASTVLKAIMSAENKLQEEMLGLAAQMFRFMNPKEASITFNQTGVDEAELALKLLEILKFYRYPSAKVPRIRRSAIELAIWMMENNKTMVLTFRALGMEEKLEIVGKTTSEIESFNIFSGTIGLSRHSTTMHTLVENAFELLYDGCFLP